MTTIIINDANYMSPPEDTVNAKRLHVRFKRTEPALSVLGTLLDNTNLRSFSFRALNGGPWTRWIRWMIHNNPDLRSLSLDDIPTNLLQSLHIADNLHKFRIRSKTNAMKSPYLMAAVRSMTNLRHLEIGGFDVDAESELIFYQNVIASHPTLRTLSISLNSNSKIYAIGAAVCRSKTITQFTLDGFFDNRDQLRILAEMIKTNFPHITFTCESLSTHLMIPELPIENLASCTRLNFGDWFDPSVEYVEQNLTALPNLSDVFIRSVDNNTAPPLIRLFELNPGIKRVWIYTMHPTAHLARFLGQLSNILFLYIDVINGREERSLVVDALINHPVLEGLCLSKRTFKHLDTKPLDLVKTIPNLFHYSPAVIMVADEEADVAKEFCWLRKQNYKAKNCTLVSRLLKFHDL